MLLPGVVDTYLDTSAARTREAVHGTNEVDERVDVLRNRVRASATDDLLVGVRRLVVSASKTSQN
jgi:hypothetical protein